MNEKKNKQHLVQDKVYEVCSQHINGKKLTFPNPLPDNDAV